MKTTCVVAVLGLMLPCMGAAQDVKFEFGTTLNAVLSDTVDARKSKPGDSVGAKTSEDLKVGGIIVIPRGAKLVGQVTAARAAAAANEQAKLGFVFERAQLKDGRKIPLHTAFYALAAPVGASDERAPPAGGGFGGAVGNLGRPAADDTSALGGGSTEQADLKPSPGAIGGLSSTGTLYASSRGVFGLDGVSLEPNTVPSKGSTVILADARNIRLVSGTRLLLSVESTE
jgi:hypothetical protein